MKTKTLICMLLALALVLSGCGAAAPVDPPAGPLAQPQYPQMAPYPDMQDYTDGETGEVDGESFALASSDWEESRRALRDQPQGYADSLEGFFRSGLPAILGTGSQENRICSPVNVYMALAALAEVTAGSSRQQILSLLAAEDLQSLRIQAEQVWNAHYCDDGASTCILANSIWLQEGLVYDPDPIQALAACYRASSYQGDLGSQQMNEMLRSWLNEQTDGLLGEQAEKVSMDPQTDLALASTICYRARWSNEFREQDNTQGLFHGPDGDTDVTFLNQTLMYGSYYWGAEFGAVTLSLEDGSRMWLVLPDEGVTPGQLLEEGTALELILDGGENWENRKQLTVNLSLPKFDAVSDLRLEDSLKSLGITDVFDPGAADFTALLPEGGGWLDSVRHAARVAVDEEGVVAAAYTVMMRVGAGRPPQEQMDFIVDRPFLFVITSRDNLPLFAGTVIRP